MVVQGGGRWRGPGLLTWHLVWAGYKCLTGRPQALACTTKQDIQCTEPHGLLGEALQVMRCCAQFQRCSSLTMCSRQLWSAANILMRSMRPRCLHAGCTVKEHACAAHRSLPRGGVARPTPGGKVPRARTLHGGGLEQLLPEVVHGGQRDGPPLQDLSPFQLFHLQAGPLLSTGTLFSGRRDAG